MTKVNEDNETQFVMFWTTLLLKDQKDYTYKDFLDFFVHPAINTLNNVENPKINEEIRRTMQLTEQVKTTDWYLYQNYTEIQVYGNELAPFQLPKFLSMRVFSLEYIRQMIHANELHFVSAKNKAQFKNKTQIGPFFCNNSVEREETENILK